jgi:hypothetical protein
MKMKNTKTDVKITNSGIKTAVQGTITQITPVIEIGHNTLVGLLLDKKGATFARLNTRTTPAMKKTNNPFYDKETKSFSIVKDSIVNVMIGMEYKNAVNNKRVKESMDEVKEALMSALGMTKDEVKDYLKSLESYADTNRANFEPKPRKWGEHMTFIDNGEKITSRTMVVHTNKDNKTCHYVQTWILNTQKPIYRYADSLEEISENDKETLKAFLTEKNSNAEHQGLKVENEIIIRTYKVESITQIRLNKTEYVLK